MRARQKVTRAGIELIASFEGLRRRAARLPDGRWTIGYGHTLSAREGAEVSPEDAEALLHFDLLPIAEAVNNLVYTPLTQNQFDALVAFAYNVGVEAFRTSDVLKRVNEGRLTEAACALDLWRKAELAGDPVILDALIRRRAAEKALFLTPPDGYVPTPTPLLRPQVDQTLAPMLPQSRPHEIEVPMDGVACAVHRVPLPAEASDEPLEISESEAEPASSQPMQSEPVEASYSDADPVETDRELEVQALEAGEPGAEALGAEEPQTASPEPEPDATAEAAPVAEPQAEPAPAEDFPPAADMPAAPVEEIAQPEPAIAAAAPAERIYAPDAAPDPENVFEAVSQSAQASPPTPGALPVSTFGYSQAPLAPNWRVDPAISAGDPAPENVLVLTPPPEVETVAGVEPQTESAPPANETDEQQSPLFEDDSSEAQAVEQRVIRHEELVEGDVPVDRPSMGPFILLGGIGFVAFGGAVSAFLKGRADGTGDLTVVAWVLAFIGAACVGTAVYFLLKRLGGVDD